MGTSPLIKNNSWNEFFWSVTENWIFQRQQKIYQARVKGDKSLMYFLQTKLLNSNIVKIFVVQIIIDKFTKYKFKHRQIIYILSLRIWYKLLTGVVSNEKISLTKFGWIP